MGRIYAVGRCCGRVMVKRIRGVQQGAGGSKIGRDLQRASEISSSLTEDAEEELCNSYLAKTKGVPLLQHFATRLDYYRNKNISRCLDWPSSHAQRVSDRRCLTKPGRSVQTGARAARTTREVLRCPACVARRIQPVQEAKAGVTRDPAVTVPPRIGRFFTRSSVYTMLQELHLISDASFYSPNERWPTERIYNVALGFIETLFLFFSSSNI